LNTPIGTDHCRSVFVLSPIPVGAHIGAVEWLKTSVVDPNHFDTDPDPDFHFVTDPDPAFHFDTDPDLYCFKEVMYPKRYVLFIHLNLIFFSGLRYLLPYVF
jgi:hypothetical protein